MTASTHLNDTKNFGQIDPGKTPVWGKPMREREFFLVLQFWKLHQQKLKPTDYLSLPRIPCMNLTERNYKTAPSIYVPRLSYSTAYPRIKCCAILLGKSCPENGSSCTIAVQLYGRVNAPSLPRFACY